MFSAMAWKSRHRLAAVVALAGIVAVAGCTEIHTRDDFTAKVDGKSMQDVRAVIGKPLTVDEGEAGSVMWTYERRTIDIENKNKRDARTVVVFTAPASDGGGTVSQVRFE
jgi:hypothetical protein